MLKTIPLAAALLLAPLTAFSAEQMLTGTEIQATVAGKTIEGSMTATGRYVEYYQADGTIRGEGYTGAWTVEGDTMCFKYGDDPADCWSVGTAGQEVLWIKDGETLGTGAIVDGNVNNF